MSMIINDINSADHKDRKIADSSVIWRTFNEVVNNRILDSNATMLSSEDKRLGAYFVTESDLKNDETGKRFAEKVIKYLWDDAFKYSRDKIFSTEFKSLESVILYFESASENEKFNIFNKDTKDLLVSNASHSSTNAGDNNEQSFESTGDGNNES